jgi:hypothetical protein
MMNLFKIAMLWEQWRLSVLGGDDPRFEDQRKCGHVMATLLNEIDLEYLSSRVIPRAFAHLATDTGLNRKLASSPISRSSLTFRAANFHLEFVPL